MIAQAPRYHVAISCYPSTSRGAGRFRRPVVVRVLDRAVGSRWHQVRQPVRAWPNVDSRYDGPRSAYGQALIAARELAARLNAEV